MKSLNLLFPSSTLPSLPVIIGSVHRQVFETADDAVDITGGLILVLEGDHLRPGAAFAVGRRGRRRRPVRGVEDGREPRAAGEYLLDRERLLPAAAAGGYHARRRRRAGRRRGRGEGGHLEDVVVVHGGFCEEKNTHFLKPVRFTDYTQRYS